MSFVPIDNKASVLRNVLQALLSLEWVEQVTSCRRPGDWTEAEQETSGGQPGDRSEAEQETSGEQPVGRA